MSTIFVDESGYTGEDLLNIEQPFFTLASLNLSELDCKELKGRFFNKVQATELKYSSLSRRPRQQKLILDFLKELSFKPELVKFIYAHKQYVLVTKMVEILVEPVTHEDGLDLYDRGANIALSNLIYYTFPVLGGEVFFQKLLRNFQNMIRFRTEQSYKAFFEPLFCQEYPQELDELLVLFRESHNKFGYNLLSTLDNLDIAFSSTLSLMSHWRQDLDDDIILIHDNSSAMAKQKKIWDAIVDPNVPPIVVGYDRRQTQFPIRVVKTCSEDSKNWDGLQLVDILAGAYTRCIKWLSEGKQSDDKFGMSLAEIMSDSFYGDPIFPQFLFTPEELGIVGINSSINSIDHISNLLIQNSQSIQ